MQWWISIIKSNFIIMDSNAKIRHRLWHDTKNVSEDRTVMLKLAIKPTFENTTPEDVRWPVCFVASSFSPWNFVGNRRIHETFVSLYFISCRIYEKWIFIISSRGYITCPDRWPGSQVPAGYKTLACKLSLYFAFVRNIMRLYCNFDFITAEGIEISPHFYMRARLLWPSSCAESESASEFSSLKIEPFHDLSKG